MEYLSPDGQKFNLQNFPGAELTSIKDYAAADAIFKKHMEKFRESMVLYERPTSIHGIDVKLFEDSKLYGAYVKELKTKFPNSSFKFKCRTGDKTTCDEWQNFRYFARMYEMGKDCNGAI